MKIHHSALTVLFALFINITSATASPVTVTEHQVNGFRVLLVNQHQGNSMQVGAHVATGSWHDDHVNHAGLAHLWEHVIHRGTLKFPDERSEATINSRLGGSHNAYTADDHTYYFRSGHPDALADSIQYIGSQISGPSWNPEYFAAEKQVVMNEAKQYQSQDQRALASGVFLALLPSNHPLWMYDVGTQEQLAAVDMGDLQDLFYSNYQPGMVTIVVSGNFDNAVNGVAPLNAENVLALIGENFVPAHDPRPQPKRPDLYRAHNKKVFPPLFPTIATTSQMVEIGSEARTKYLTLQFEIPTAVLQTQGDTIETLFDYLNLSTEGSLAHTLKKRGWINSMGVSTQTVNNLAIVQVYFDLTEDGAKNRQDLPSYFLNAVSQVEALGIPEDLLATLRRHNISAYTKQAASAQGSQRILTRYLGQYKNAQDIFDFEKRYGSISNTMIKKAIWGLLNPNRMLVGYIGSDVKSQETLPLFARPMRKIHSAELLAKWQTARFGTGSGVPIFQPKMAAIPLNFSTQPHEGQNTEIHKAADSADGTEVYVQENHSSTLAALSLELQTPAPDVRTRAARHLLASVFAERYRSELEYLNASDIAGGIGPDHRGWMLGVQGNSTAAISAVHWMLNALRTLSPTDVELAKAQKKMQSQLSQSHFGFSARQAMGVSQTLLVNTLYPQEQLTEEASKLTPADVTQVLAADFTAMDLRLISVGDVTEAAAKQLVTAVAELIPQRLNTAQRADWGNEQLELPNHPLRVWQAMPAVKEAEEFGHVRIYQGAKLGTPEEAALRVLQQVAAAEVFLINRSRKGLGYMHSAVKLPGRDSLHLVFYGETGIQSRWGEIAEGWNEIVEMARNAAFSDEDLINSIIGLGRAEQLVADTPMEEAGQILASLKLYKDVHGAQRMAELIQSLKPEDVIRVAQQILLGNRTVDVTLSRPTCVDLLLSPDQAKAQMRSATSSERKLEK